MCKELFASQPGVRVGSCESKSKVIKNSWKVLDGKNVISFSSIFGFHHASSSAFGRWSMLVLISAFHAFIPELRNEVRFGKSHCFSLITRLKNSTLGICPRCKTVKSAATRSRARKRRTSTSRFNGWLRIPRVAAAESSQEFYIYLQLGKCAAPVITFLSNPSFCFP